MEDKKDRKHHHHHIAHVSQFYVNSISSSYVDIVHLVLSLSLLFANIVRNSESSRVLTTRVVCKEEANCIEFRTNELISLSLTMCCCTISHSLPSGSMAVWAMSVNSNNLCKTFSQRNHSPKMQRKSDGVVSACRVISFNFRKSSYLPYGNVGRLICCAEVRMCKL